MVKILKFVPKERCFLDKELVNYVNISGGVGNPVIDRHVVNCGSCGKVYLKATKKKNLKPV